MKVCHISTVHARNDVRIFQKELLSLTKAYETFFIVADGEGNSEVNDVKIIDIGLRNSSRIKRATEDSNKALKKALELDCDIYHLHDPELLKIGLKLKKHKKKVIFDAHEDLPQQILTKEYIPKTLRKLISVYYSYYESYASKKLDAIVSATPTIESKFSAYGARAISVCNYPIIKQSETNYSESNRLVYIGGISESRGILNMLDAIENSDYKLNLAGKFFNEEIELKAKSHPGWNRINWLGFIDSDEVESILSESSIGLVLLHPYRSYKESLPVKMFEYMNAGLPFIASRFPIWEEISNKHNCGICVNPEDSKEINKAIQQLIQNPDLAKRMGLNGKAAIKSEYNWGVEKDKLLELYKSLDAQ